MKKTLLSFILLFCSIISFLAAGSSDYEYWIGADVSEIPANEARGMRYKDIDGTIGDPLEIMKRHGFNIIRLRLFVNPQSPIGYSKDGFCGTESTIAFAKRIKAAGMKFALDFHFSDSWADPDKQIKPFDWKDNEGKELSGKALEKKVYEYVKTTLAQFKEANAAPEVIQIGNEINHGFLWPEGKLLDNAVETDWPKMMNPYISAQKAVREILPDAKIQVHLALGGENKLTRNFLNHMKRYQADFDIIGLSYYEKWHETYDDLHANIYDLAQRYKKPIVICEYGANPNNTRKINDIVRMIPNGLGYGTMAWAPSNTLFPRGQANAEMFKIFESMKKDFSAPLDIEKCIPPVKRVVKFETPMIGADISMVPSQEARGTKFSDENGTADLLEILKRHHFNWIRLRLFVDPTAKGGYSQAGYCGLESTLAYAKRIKAAGLNFLLDLHYSDNWADPEKQHKPASWSRDTGSRLEGKVYSYTYDIVKRFSAEGARPDMIQTGNEITNGMLWPQGKIENDIYEPFAVMLRCATAAVRAADPTIPVLIHSATGGNNMKSVHFYDKIISRDVKFDVIGLSYYPKYHGTLEQMSENINDLAKRYEKPVVIVEYQDYRQEVNEIVHDVPNGMGAGTFIWEATSPMWGALFDSAGKATKRLEIYDEFYKKIHDKQ